MKNSIISLHSQKKLKCRYHGEIRTVIVNEASSITELLKRLKSDYGFNIALKYEDEDNELVVLSSQNDFDTLLLCPLSTINVFVSEAQVLPSLQRVHQSSVSNSLFLHNSSIESRVEGNLDSHRLSRDLTTEFPSLDRKLDCFDSSDDSSCTTDRNSDISSKTENRIRKLPSHVVKRAIGVAERSIRVKRGEIIGQGAFGVVYLGLNLDSGELMAVKQMSADEVSSKELITLENEINLLQNLKHKNIVRYLGMDMSGSNLSIFLEYVSGGSIKALISKFGALDESIVRSYTRQLLLGLEYLHRHGIAHRDIKGANCLVGNDGVIKLADFGNSKRWRVDSPESLQASLKSSGDLKGTPCWMAPEIIKDESSSVQWKKADVWSLACTTLEMITGRPPWSQFDNTVTILYHIACEDTLPEYPDPASIELISFLNLCLQRKADMRPDTTSLLLHPFVMNVASQLWRYEQMNSTSSYGRPSTVSIAPANGQFSRNSVEWFSSKNEPSDSFCYFENSRKEEYSNENDIKNQVDDMHSLSSQEDTSNTQFRDFQKIDNDNMSIVSALTDVCREVHSDNFFSIDDDDLSQSESIDIEAKIISSSVSPIGESCILHTDVNSKNLCDDDAHCSASKTNLTPLSLPSNPCNSMDDQLDYNPILNQFEDMTVTSGITPLSISHSPSKIISPVKRDGSISSAASIAIKDKSPLVGVRKNTSNYSIRPLFQGDVDVSLSYESPLPDPLTLSIPASVPSSSTLPSPKNLNPLRNNSPALLKQSNILSSQFSFKASKVNRDSENREMENVSSASYTSNSIAVINGNNIALPANFGSEAFDSLCVTGSSASPMSRGGPIIASKRPVHNASTPLSALRGVPICRSPEKTNYSANFALLSTPISNSASLSINPSVHMMNRPNIPRVLDSMDDNLTENSQENSYYEQIGPKENISRLSSRSSSQRESFRFVRTATSTTQYSHGADHFMLDGHIDSKFDHRDADSLLLDSNETSTIRLLAEHASGISRLRLPTKTSLLLSGSWDGTIKIWGLRSNERESRMTLDAQSFQEDGKASRKISLGSKVTSNHSSNSQSHTECSSHLRIMNLWAEEACQSIWAACSDNTLRIWGGTEGKPLRMLKGHEDSILALEGVSGLGPQSSCLVATGSADRSVRVWDLRAKRSQIFFFKGHSDAVTTLRWSESGRAIVSAGKDKSIRIWDTRSGRLRSTLEKHFGSVTALRNVPEEVSNSLPSHLAFLSGGRDSMINLWTSSGDCIGTQAAHRGSVHYISEVKKEFFSSGSPAIVSLGADNMMKLWDLKKFRPIFETSFSLDVASKAVWRGKSVITGSSSGIIREWKIQLMNVNQSDGYNSMIENDVESVNSSSGSNSLLNSSIEGIASNYGFQGLDIGQVGSSCTDLISNDTVVVCGSKSGQIWCRTN